MSKSKKKKRKNNSPKPSKKKNYIPIAAAAVLIIAAAVVLFFVFNNFSDGADFAGRTLTASKAFDASGDEAELAKVYNVRYDSYKGTMTFNEDGTFSFWMTPGSKDDGVHGGKYTYNADKKLINAAFDDGEKIKIKVIRNKDGSFKRVEVPYQGYKVYMK